MNRLQALEVFVASVRHGSFSGAARRLGLSPASASRIVAELEASLRVTLLNRTSRSLSLTEVGAVYLRRVEPLLDGLREAEAAAGAFQQRPGGRLRVHSRLMFGNRVIAPLIPGFQHAHPEIAVELYLAERPADLAGRDAGIDVEIRIGRPHGAGLVQRLILPSERILVASPDYLAGAPPVRVPADLAAHRCLAYWMGPQEPTWRFQHAGALEEVAIAPHVVTNSGEVLRTLAVLGHGITLLNDYTVEADVRAGRLRQVLPDVPVTNASFAHGQGIYAVFRQAAFVPAKVQVFLDYLGAARIRALARPGGPPPSGGLREGGERV